MSTAEWRVFLRSGHVFILGSTCPFPLTPLPVEEHASAELSRQGRKHGKGPTVLNHRIHKDGTWGPILVSEGHGKPVPDMACLMKTIMAAAFLQPLLFPRVVSTLQDRWVCLS